MSRFRAEFLLTVMCIVWGSTFVVLKVVIGDAETPGAWSPMVLTGTRFLLSAVAVLVMFGGRSLPRRGVEWRAGLVIGLAHYGGYALQAVGIEHTTPEKSAFITNLYVIFAPLIAWVWSRERPGPGLWIALPVALAGLWLIGTDNGSGTVMGIRALLDLNSGDILTLLSALCFGFEIAAIQRYTTQHAIRAMPLMFLQLILVTVLAAGTFPFIETPRISFAWEPLLGVLYLGLIATTATIGIQMAAQRYTTTQRASFVYLWEPVFGAVFVGLFAAQGIQLSPLGYLGAGLIITATLLNHFGENLKRVPLPPLWRNGRRNTIQNPK